MLYEKGKDCTLDGLVPETVADFIICYTMLTPKSLAWRRIRAHAIIFGVPTALGVGSALAHRAGRTKTTIALGVLAGLETIPGIAVVGLAAYAVANTHKKDGTVYYNAVPARSEDELAWMHRAFRDAPYIYDKGIDRQVVADTVRNAIRTLPWTVKK